MVAKYKCWNCGHEWETRVEGGSFPLKYPHSDNCPRCDNLYFEWKNYDEQK